MKAARAARIMTAKRYRVRLEYPQLARFQQILAQLGGSQEDESVCGERRVDRGGAAG